MIVNIPLKDSRHSTRRAINVRVVLPETRVPVPGCCPGRGDVLLVRGVSES